MIAVGLVLATPGLEKILSGRTVWEIRTGPHSHVGRVALVRADGLIVATGTIGESSPLPVGEFAFHFLKHRMPREELEQTLRNQPLHVWPLSEVRRLKRWLRLRDRPKETGGWIELSRANVLGWERLAVL
jgi:hypothetical protein